MDLKLSIVGLAGFAFHGLEPATLAHERHSRRVTALLFAGSVSYRPPQSSEGRSASSRHEMNHGSSGHHEPGGLTAAPHYPYLCVDTRFLGKKFEADAIIRQETPEGSVHVAVWNLSQTDLAVIDGSPGKGVTSNWSPVDPKVYDFKSLKFVADARIAYSKQSLIMPTALGDAPDPAIIAGRVILDRGSLRCLDPGPKPPKFHLKTYAEQPFVEGVVATLPKLSLETSHFELTGHGALSGKNRYVYFSASDGDPTATICNLPGRVEDDDSGVVYHFAHYYDALLPLAKPEERHLPHYSPALVRPAFCLVSSLGEV